MLFHNQEGKTGQNRSWISYCIAAGITLMLSLALAAALHIYPFGDNGILFMDGSQYFSAAGYLQRALLNGESLFYSWSNVLGNNALPLLSYYGSLPFNLLLVLFPDNLLLGVHVIVLLKLLCAALAFCWLLNGRVPGHLAAKGVFAGCYPLIGYAVTHIWNIAWLDGIVMLPLIFGGISLLVEKRKFLLYSLSLGFCIFSNFYIGFILCIASVLFYFTDLLLSPQGFRAAFRRSVLLFAAASLLAGGISMILCLPAILGLPTERANSFTEILSQEKAPVPFHMMGVMLLSGAWGLLEDIPLIFAGIPVLVLAVLYFFNRSISGRQRLCLGGLLLFLVISFRSPFINLLWHGTSIPHDFNFRYAFLFSFLLIVLAFDCFTHLAEQKPVFLLWGLLPALFVISQRGFYIYNSTPNTRLLDLLMIPATLICCWGLCSTRIYEKLHLSRCSVWIRRLLMLGLFGMLCLNMAENSYLLLRAPAPQEQMGEGYVGCPQAIDRCPAPSAGVRYLEARDAFALDRQAIDAPGFYRMEQLNKWYRCDSTLFGYKSLADFFSTDHGEITQLCQDLGASRYIPFYADYHRFVPAATDSLLGIRYILSHGPMPIKSHYPVQLLDTGHYLYENPTAFSLILPAEGLDNRILPEELPFDEMNRFYSTLRADADPVFTPVDPHTRSFTDDEGFHIVMEFTAGDSRPVYLSSPLGTVPTLQMLVNGEAVDWPLDRDHKIFFLGAWEQGTEVRLELRYPEEVSLEAVTLCQENQDAVSRVWEAVPFVDVTEVSASHLTFALDSSTALQHIATTIPYDRGWAVTDNGEAVDTVPNWNGCFLAFDLEGAGTHQVELRFTPRGFWPGAVISAASLAGMVILELLLQKKRISL